MKSQTDSVTDDELLLRLVWEDRFTENVPVISPNSFEPREGRNPDTDGISLYRVQCLANPEDVLQVVPIEKRDRYGIVAVPVKLFREELRLSVVQSPGPISGHVIIPEMNVTDYKANKAGFTPIKVRLAEVASEHIIRRPPSKAAE